MELVSEGIVFSGHRVLAASAKRGSEAVNGQDALVGAAAASPIGTGKKAVRLMLRWSTCFYTPGLHSRFGAAAGKNTNTSTSTTTETPTAEAAVLSELLRTRQRASAAKVSGSIGAHILNGRADLAA